jgi:tetratricopeptide (TPR) repeat protein
MSLLHAVVWCAVALSKQAIQATQSPPPGVSRAELVRLVASVQDADYRGELVRLRALADTMQPYTASRDGGARARYWRGFAHWRHALNSLNDGAGEDSVDQDFAAAIAEFREALAGDSTDIESRIGLAAGLGNRAYFNRRDRERATEFLTELGPLLARIRSEAPDNPRMMFVVAANLFWAPPGRGGDRDAALAMLRRGIRLAASEPSARDGLEPAWGEPELHMLLGWFSLNLDPPDRASARTHAEEALRLRPHWRYVRDRLLPQTR